MYHSQLMKTILGLSLALSSCISDLSGVSAEHLARQVTMEIELEKIVELEQGYGSELAFTQDGQTWAAAKQGAIYIWQNFQLQKAVTLPGYIRGSVHFSKDGKSLIAGSVIYQNEQITTIPNLPEQLIAKIPPETDPRPELFSVVNAVWSPDTKDVAVFSKYNPPRELGSDYDYEGPWSRLLLLSGQTGELKQVLEPDCGIAESYAIAISEEWIAAGGDSISVWERKTGHKVVQLTEKSTMIRDLQFNHDASRIAAVRADGSVEVWETADWSEYSAWQAHEDLPRTVTFHPQLPLLVTGGDDAQLKIWSLETTEPELIKVTSFADKIEGIAFEPTGKKLIVASRFQDATIYWYEFKVSL